MNANTNTANTNTAEIMSRAHRMTRNIIRDYPLSDYRVTFAAALRICWREAGKTAAEIVAGMTGEEINQMLIGVTWHEYRIRDARCNRHTGKTLQNVFRWVNDRHPADDLEGVAHEAYIRLAGYLIDPDRENQSLGHLASRAVQIAAQYIDRQERRNPRAIESYATDDGEELDRIRMAPRTMETAPNPEARTIIRDMINRAAADDIDRDIIAGLAYGYTRREIAERIGISHTAVNKRVNKIRERYSAE